MSTRHERYLMQSPPHSCWCPAYLHNEGSWRGTVIYRGGSWGEAIDAHNSINIITFIMDNNMYLDFPDNRFALSYKYQFN